MAWRDCRLGKAAGRAARGDGSTTACSRSHAGEPPALRSPFAAVLAFSDWLHARGVKTSGVALARRYELLWDYLTTVAGIAPAEAAAALASDFRRGGRTGTPEFLREHVIDTDVVVRTVSTAGLPKRQARHAATAAP